MSTTNESTTRTYSVVSAHGNTVSTHDTTAAAHAECARQCARAQNGNAYRVVGVALPQYDELLDGDAAADAAAPTVQRTVVGWTVLANDCDTDWRDPSETLAASTLFATAEDAKEWVNRTFTDWYGDCEWSQNEHDQSWLCGNDDDDWFAAVHPLYAPLPNWSE